MNKLPALGLGVSLVVHKTALGEIRHLLTSMAECGVSQLYVIDNTPGALSAAAAEAMEGLLQECTARRSGFEFQHPGKNLGYGTAHNLAIERSTREHKYHLICNPDITLAAHTLEVLYEFMEAHQDVGLCMPKLIGSDGQMHYCCRRSPVVLDYLSQLLSPRSWGRRRKHALEMRSSDYHQAMEVACLSGCFMFFRSDVLRRLGGFDEKFFLYFEDLDLSARARKLARNVYYPHTWVVHERRSAHRTSWRLKVHFAVSGCRYFSKWGWLSSKVDRATGAAH